MKFHFNTKFNTQSNIKSFNSKPKSQTKWFLEFLNKRAINKNKFETNQFICNIFLVLNVLFPQKGKRVFLDLYMIHLHVTQISWIIYREKTKFLQILINWSLIICMSLIPMILGDVIGIVPCKFTYPKNTIFQRIRKCTKN